MKELTLKKSLFSIFILLPISILMSGYVIKYGWNEIISTINGISSITFKQAIGIDIVASFILASRRTKDDRDFQTIAISAITSPLITLLVLWIVAIFM